VEFILALLFFVFGTVIGSFLNVVIDRLPQGRTIWKGRSVCDSCHKVLSPLELVPIVSYLFLGGKCKHCHAKIPLRLTIVELLAGISFALVLLYSWQGANLLTLLFSLIIVCLCFLIFFIDLDYGIIPDEILVIMGVLSLIYILASPGLLLQHLATAIVTLILFLSLFLVTKGRGMGFGDVKLSFVMGLLLGFPAIIYALYFAFLTGAFISVILILKGHKNLKSKIPFGPFLSLGILFGYFLSDFFSAFIGRYFGW
jgi:prepilin signal peptidase PulO-like enzyme (type II secretory pathway)